MASSVETLLRPNRILGVFERVRKGPTSMSDFLGFGIGGANRTPVGGRTFNYDTFNRTRKIARGRAAGAVSSRIAPQVVGSVQGTFPRVAETIQLLDEKIFNVRPIGGPSGILDRAGEQYITRQEQYLATRFANVIEFQSAAVLRGKYSYVQSGDDLFHDFTGGTVIDFQSPPGNQDQLDMLGDGDIIDASWSTAATDIPDQLMKINEAMLQLTGLPLEHILTGPSVWGYLISNTKIAAVGGTANVTFERFDIQGNGNFQAKLRALPWLTIHIVSHGLDVGTSEDYTSLIEADHAIFTPSPDPSWITYGEGSEMVTEGPNGVRAERMGIYPYAYPSHDPSGFNMTGIGNGIPHLYVPAAVAYGDTTL